MLRFWKSPKGVFVFLIILTFFAGLVSIPQDARLKFSIGSFSVDRTIRTPFRFTTHMGLDLAGGTHLVLEADTSQIPSSDQLKALEATREIIERRVNFFGIAEPIVQTVRSQKSSRIVVELPGVTNIADAVDTIGQTAKLEFREFIVNPATASAIFPDLSNTKPLGITGGDLKTAGVVFDPNSGKPQISIEFTPQGAEKFADATKRLVGQPIPIFLDEFILTWPTVETPILDGRGVITGNFTSKEAKILALQLSAGALPVPVTIVEKRTIGATLGEESIAKSVRAGGIGLAFVAVFMIVQYGFLGVLADLALVLYGLFTYALFRIIPITLTLPGIAGFILSIGMAVDSNILIFERFREEKQKGKQWNIAIELAFGKAWESIRDANFTTILTAIILFNPGNWQFLPSSGLVRGFALTLLLGVLVSLFTGIVVTRTFIRVLYKEKTV